MENYVNPSGEFTPEEKMYDQYIRNHIKNVKDAFDERAMMLQRVLGLSHAEMEELIGRVEVHDQSKFSNEEFPAYQRYFYPAAGESQDDLGFAEAWAHHYTVNDHHPEHWVVNNIPQPMSKTAIAEMLLDWEAMSYNFGGNPRQYFRDSKKSIGLHPETNQIVVRALNILYNEDDNLKKYKPPILG